jgi:hypothetical protein
VALAELICAKRRGVGAPIFGVEDRAEPFLAGRVNQAGPLVTLIYAQRYRTRPDAISLFMPELPLRSGIQEPADGLSIAGVLRDGSPDRWGRGVIERRKGATPNSLTEMVERSVGLILPRNHVAGNAGGFSWVGTL